MILLIQPDESLRSYIERNIHLNWRNPTGLFESLSRFSLSSMDLRKITAHMGWPGCYGFNRLLHLHTHYPTRVVFKNNQELSYSHSEYVGAWVCYGVDWGGATYCPECVKEDLQRLGFSYWRRQLSHDLEVCATHNVVLIDACPNCQQPFSCGGHNLDVMWRTCDGVHLSEGSSQKNEDPLKLKKARFYADLACLDLSIPVDAALKVLKSKIALVQLSEASSYDVLEQLKNDIDRAFLYEATEQLVEAVLELYDSLGQFVEDVVAQGYRVRRVETLWATYRAEDRSSAHYVEES